MKFVDGVVKELEPQYGGHMMIVVQRFGSWSTWEMHMIQHFSQQKCLRVGKEVRGKLLDVFDGGRR